MYDLSEILFPNPTVSQALRESIPGVELGAEWNA